MFVLPHPCLFPENLGTPSVSGSIVMSASVGQAITVELAKKTPFTGVISPVTHL